MKAQPPRLAAWLLGRLGCGPNNDAVLGDIVERYQEGYGAPWFWWQTLAAILFGFKMRIMKGGIGMKQMAIRTLVIAGVFLLGVLAGVRPWNRLQEIASVQPPPDIRALDRTSGAAQRPQQDFGTGQFFLSQLDKARAIDAREHTSESKERVAFYDKKLHQVLSAKESGR